MSHYYMDMSHYYMDMSHYYMDMSHYYSTKEKSLNGNRSHLLINVGQTYNF
jgi:ferritin